MCIRDSKKTPDIANTEINEFIINRQFSVFSVYNFTRNDPQITYTLGAKQLKKRWHKIKDVITRVF